MINNKDDDRYKMKYDDAIKTVKELVDTTLGKAPLIIREYTKHLTTSHGKFIRASSVLICAENSENKIHPNAIKVAAAIEMLHLATLVHDDIIDNADIRRGNLTLQKKYGKRTAVICGDYLLCISLKLVASIPNKEEYLNLDLPDYMGRICLGELNQHTNNWNVNLSIYQYLKIIAGKTAALFEASFYGGAIFSGAEEKEAKKYKQLGFCIGMIFQLTDDCIDFEKTREVAHKPVQSDYEQGVITLPLIHALQQSADFKKKAEQSEITRSEINEVVVKTGGLKFAQVVVHKYYKKAKKIISQLDMNDVKKEKLMMILDKASRKH